MDVERLTVENVGPIKHVEVQLGDLTVLVGPQATGKSIFLQFLKLLVDTGPVLADLKRYGLDWHKGLSDFLDIYLGEGMRDVWHQSRSRLIVNDAVVGLEQLVSRQKKNKEETLFFIPAQRVLTLGKGWPRPFTDYSAGDPFAVRDFSEKLRLLMETELGRGESLFPQSRRLKVEIRNLLNNTVFSNFGLRVDRHGTQKRLVLGADAGHPLPFMVWSAGQREFVPLLLGLYWLLPPTRAPRRAAIKWVVIEEIEMGLHPKAISTVLLLILELLARGYKVCLSTHSPHVLDVVWALKVLKEHKADADNLLNLFDVPHTQVLQRMAREVLTKDARVYYFDPQDGRSRDISALDPDASDAEEAGWGGLTEFSGRVADVVASVVSGSSE